ncbi:putative transcription factor bHLH family [Helianthus annuus]|nr:putative transcription factor bHLH family [Helianthus annuus]
MDNRGFMNRDDMSKPYNRSFQTPTSFEDQTESKLPGYDHKASSINTVCQTSKTIVTSLSSSNTFTIPFDDSVGLQISGTGKKDKVSVLEDAANYIKELQDRVKQFEGLSGIEKNGNKECIVALKRSRIRGDNDMGSSPKNETNTADVTCEASTEIEVRISGSSVLVTLQSHKNSSLLVKVLSKMQKLGLSIISSSAIPFANTTSIITVVAQVNVLQTNIFIIPGELYLLLSQI